KAADGTRRLVEPARPMTVRDVMMHMSGLGDGPPHGDLDLGALGRRQPADRFGEGATLETLIERLAEDPLRFHPGTHWLYSWSTDVCARLVEVISGQPFDEYLQQTIFDPLGMPDTGFYVPEDKPDRLAALYPRSADKQLQLLDDPTTSRSRRKP